MLFKLTHFALSDVIEDSAKAEKSGKPIVIISRQFCFEVSREIPIAKVDEAIKAAENMDNVAPFEGKTYFVVEKSTHEKCRVTFFAIQQSVFEKYANTAWIVLPETLLVKLAMGQSRGKGALYLEAQRNERKLVVHNSESEFRSFLIKEGQSVPAYFPQVVAEVDQKTLSQRNYEEYLLKTLLKVKGYIFKQAFQTHRLAQLNKNIPWVQGGATLACVGVLYLLGTSAYIHLKTANIESPTFRSKRCAERSFCDKTKN